MIFQRLIWAGLLTALLVGSVQTAVQQWQATPLILAAEAYEDQKAPAPAHHAHADGHAHSHDHEAHEAWSPADGAERTLWTWVANTLHAFSMALIVFAVMGYCLYRQRATSLNVGASMRLAAWVAAAGWLSFHLWPSLGLHAEVPGMDAAPLRARQFWWALAVACAVAACGLVAFARGHWRWLAAIVLLAIPFVIGAPQLQGDALARFGPEAHAALTQLADRFKWATAWVAASFWLCMGLVAGWAFQRWVAPAILASLHGTSGQTVAAPKSAA